MNTMLRLMSSRFTTKYVSVKYHLPPMPYVLLLVSAFDPTVVSFSAIILTSFSLLLLLLFLPFNFSQSTTSLRSAIIYEAK